jgi:2-oxoglutarate dehydrogenase E2 component (dihydrolipoamide succinyltransferase)
MPVDVKMPQLGESVVEGTVSRWLKRAGEPIKLHEPLLEVTTDKVDTEIPSTVEGTVLELLIDEGETVKVGTVIARLSSAHEQPELVGTTARASGDGASTEAASAAAFISPAVARLAAQYAIDLKQVSGSGANGRVTKKDVERHLQERHGYAQSDISPSAAPAPPSQPAPTTTHDMRWLEPIAVEHIGDAFQVQPLEKTAAAEPPATLADGDELVPLSPIRRSIAEHMARSKRVAPHVTTVMEADLTRVAAHREQHRAEYARQGVRLTYTAYFVEATLAALRGVPSVNASFREDGIEVHDHINVGIAVALEDGLIVPVIKDADDLSLLGLARAIGDLAERARIRRLHPSDVEGGTFTITNHGVSGSIFATPIINQPQAAILGIGAIEKRAVVISDAGFDAIAIRLRCYLSLTFDHRVFDGATADRFLGTVKQVLESYGS